jgi:hypothetical protein
MLGNYSALEVGTELGTWETLDPNGSGQLCLSLEALNFEEAAQNTDNNPLWISSSAVLRLQKYPLLLRTKIYLRTYGVTIW